MTTDTKVEAREIFRFTDTGPRQFGRHQQLIITQQPDGSIDVQTEGSSGRSIRLNLSPAAREQMRKALG